VYVGTGGAAPGSCSTRWLGIVAARACRPWDCECDDAGRGGSGMAASLLAVDGRDDGDFPFNDFFDDFSFSSGLFSDGAGDLERDLDWDDVGRDADGSAAGPPSEMVAELLAPIRSGDKAGFGLARLPLPLLSTGNPSIFLPCAPL
jgi:hypothetical protein